MNFADHSEKFSRDSLNRYLCGEKRGPKSTRENAQPRVVQPPKGFVVFDVTVADRNFSHEIELVRQPYSGSAHAVIEGIGLVTCVYVNPATDQFWIIVYVYRIYDPDGDGKTKLDHSPAIHMACA